MNLSRRPQKTKRVNQNREGTIDQRSGGVYIQDGKVYVRGNLIGRDMIVINLPPMTWLAPIALVLPAIIIAAFLVFPQLQGEGKMAGDINVAVAEFGELDPQNKVVYSSKGFDLAESFFEGLDSHLKSLEAELASSGLPLDIEVRGPAQVRRVRGATREEWAEDARRIASEHHADLVVYGNFGAGRTNFAADVYISERLLHDAEELAGQHEFGSETLIMGNEAANVIAFAELRQRMTSGTRALAFFVIGLGYFGSDRFDIAGDYFSRALGTEGADDPGIKQIFYLFAGKSAYELKDWNKAQKYYAEALQINPEYSRAQLGYADMVFQQARDNCEQGKVDARGLQQAIDGYQNALKARDQPALADIKTKVSLYLSRAYFCQSRANVANRWDDAEREAMAVIAEFEGGNQRVKDLASEAHADLGLIYWTRPASDNSAAQANLRRATEEYGKAIELNGDAVKVGRRIERQAIFHGMLAQIYEDLGEFGKADEAFAEAIRLDPIKPSPYEKLWHEFRQKRTGSPDATPTKFSGD